LDFQLTKNKQILEEKLDFNCEYFAWTYGQLQHFPKKALNATQKYHKYIYIAELTIKTIFHLTVKY